MSKYMKKLTVARTTIGLVVIAALVLCGRILALPTPTQFELDGNALVNSPPADDWANTVPTKTASSEALTSAFIADGSGNVTIFTTGGSKDINDLNQWQWKDQLGGLPDKDNITNAYAAAYTAANGDLIIYFGADRFTTEGDAQLGFWFFKQRVQTLNGIFVNGAGQPATHVNGDILVLANMSNGGTVFTAQVFQWLNGGLSPLVTTPGDAHCGTNVDPNVCFTTNAAQVPAPWAYTAKDGTTGNFPALTFFEGGINVSHFSQGAPECFSSFLVETRSSTSQSATLKDFALGEFNTCRVDIVKNCPDVSFDPVTGLLTYGGNITVTNSGFGTLYDLVVTDSPTGAPQQQFQLTSLGAGQSHVFPYTFTLTPGPGTPNPPTNSATVAAAPSPGGNKIVTAGPAQATCQHVDFDANLTITKSCAARVEVQNNRVVVVVDIQGQVCNVPTPGVFPEAINNVNVTDTPTSDPATIPLGVLAPNQCKTYQAKYYPDSIAGTGNPHDQTYLDTAMAAGTSSITQKAKANTASANCPLCP